MPTINRLSAVSSVVSSDQVPIYSSDNGDARKASMAIIAAFIQTLITSTDDKITQYAAPIATGFTVPIGGTGQSVWLILTPLAGYATGTITMPLLSTCVDKQEILVNTTQAVATFAVSPNGATVIGAPGALLANAFFRLRFDGVLKTWYRVG